MEHDGWTYIYLTGQRKAFHHDTKGWEGMAYERFDYVECGIYRKRTAELGVMDKMMAEDYGEPDSNFITPSGWREPSTLLPAPPKATDAMPIGVEVQHKLAEARFQPPTAFPTTIEIGSAKIVMHLDGTWSGDREAYIRALTELRGHFGLNAVLMWVVARMLTPETERKP